MSPRARQRAAALAAATLWCAASAVTLAQHATLPPKPTASKAPAAPPKPSDPRGKAEPAPVTDAHGKGAASAAAADKARAGAHGETPEKAAPAPRQSATEQLRDAGARIQQRVSEVLASAAKAAPSRPVTPPTPRRPRIALNWRVMLVWPSDVVVASPGVADESGRVLLSWK